MIEEDLLRELLLIYVIAMGACIGSFINVVIVRLPEGKSVVRPGSKCPKCDTSIPWHDNIPILSFLLLLGKCRVCKVPISPRYPLIEIVMAALMAAFWVRFGLSWELLVWLPLSATVVVIAFIDIDHWIIPDVLVFPMMLWVLGGVVLSDSMTLLSSGLGLIPAGIIFAVGWCFEKFTGREGLGFGDVKLLALIGLAVGPVSALNILLLSSFQGAFIGIIMRLFTSGHEAQKSSSTKEDSIFDDDWVPPAYAIPFGPFLVLATLQCILLPATFGSIGEKISYFLLGIMG